jgi:hypothetical protein
VSCASSSSGRQVSPHLTAGRLSVTDMGHIKSFVINMSVMVQTLKWKS